MLSKSWNSSPDSVACVTSFPFLLHHGLSQHFCWLPPGLLQETAPSSSANKLAAADGHGRAPNHTGSLAGRVASDSRRLGAASIGARNRFGLGSEAKQSYTGLCNRQAESRRIWACDGGGIARLWTTNTGCGCWPGRGHVRWYDALGTLENEVLVSKFSCLCAMGLDSYLTAAAMASKVNVTESIVIEVVVRHQLSAGSCLRRCLRILNVKEVKKDS